MSWGMTVNGECLTASTTESRRTGKECSLLDILEDRVDDKYFLSEKQKEMMQNWKSQQNPLKAPHLRQGVQESGIAE